MLDKLKLIEERFGQLGELLILPETISDQPKYINLSKEYKDLQKIIEKGKIYKNLLSNNCLLYTSPSPRDRYISRMPSSA